MAHKAAPIAMECAVGDLISFRRKREDENPERKWFDCEPNHRTRWRKGSLGIVRGSTCCTATGKIRPCTPSET
eukprot:9074586-Karenia_brevis.AAC.1